MQLINRAICSLLSTKWMSSATGWLADRQLPKPILRFFIRRFAKSYNVDLDECEHPVESFDTFNEFFTRSLKPGTRPLPSSLESFVSPCDGVVSSSGMIAADHRVEQIKGRDYDLKELVVDAPLAEKLEGGFATTIYLSPRDYHRIHVPATGQLVKIAHVPGRRYPVDLRARKSVKNLYAVNERVIFTFETTTYGSVVLVMVGAANVSRITCSHADIPREPDDPELLKPEVSSLKRGDELARFNLGSTVVLLVERADPKQVLHESESVVRMGELLLRSL